jgi:hypothetical protein
MQKKKKKKTYEKNLNQNLKLLNYKELLTQKRILDLKKKSNKFCKKTKRKYVFYLCVISPN